MVKLLVVSIERESFFSEIKDLYLLLKQRKRSFGKEMKRLIAIKSLLFLHILITSILSKVYCEGHLAEGVGELSELQVRT